MAASQHFPHSDLGPHPTGLSVMVPGQLLPYGIQRFAVGDNLWSQKGSGLDVWLIRGHMHTLCNGESIANHVKIVMIGVASGSQRCRFHQVKLRKHAKIDCIPEAVTAPRWFLAQ